jgi:release factor glutamine methyltransferase
VTLHEHTARARDRLIDAGIPLDEAALDARLLAQFLLGWDGVRFVTGAREPAPPDFASRYEGLIGRRERREPLAYITGHREFWGLDFEVSPAVLIPRPETELIVEVALELLTDRSAPLLVADACTGSGCLAIALAHEYPASSIVATDTSIEALQVARRMPPMTGSRVSKQTYFGKLADPST